uniref:DNA (cytosine-5-)-methyltransferase n=1 Tax=Chaetoceros debilis TaxID=122233 RepID=A0A7S3V9W5_9STRA
MDENEGRRRNIRDRISELEKERHETLQFDKRFTSNDENVDSFGKLEVFQEGTQQKYNKRKKVLEDELKALGEGTNEQPLLLDHHSLRCKRRRLNRKRTNRRNSVESYDHTRSREENKCQRDVGSQSDRDSPTSECDSGRDNECSSSEKQTRKEVIEILDSSDSSDDDDQIHTERNVDAEVIDSSDLDDDEVNEEGNDSQLSGEDNIQESSENLAQQTPLDSGRMESDDDHFDSDDDEDEDDVRSELRKENMNRIEESKLSMAVQGFRQKSVEVPQPPDIDDIDDIDGSSQTSIAIANDAIPFEAEGGEVIHHGERFRKNHCYLMDTGGGNQEIVGILDFVSDHAARCILVVRFEDTIIGIEDEGLEYKADYIHESHVQIYKEVSIVELSELGEEPEDVKEIPKLIYEPQRDGIWCQFGYFYNEHSFIQAGRRNQIKSLEFFAGCGGSLQGYHSCNFKTVMAIENDDMAVKTLKANNEGLRVYEGCVRDFIKDYDTFNFALGRIDHVHYSPPCKGFSTEKYRERTFEIELPSKMRNVKSL